MLVDVGKIVQHIPFVIRLKVNLGVDKTKRKRQLGKGANSIRPLIQSAQGNILRLPVQLKQFLPDCQNV